MRVQAAVGGGLIGLLALGLLVGLRGTFHPADLVVVLSSAGAALLVQHLFPPAVPTVRVAPTQTEENLQTEIENLRKAREALAKALATAIDCRMDAALAVARLAATSAREGDRLAALAEELRVSAEGLRGELDSISRFFSTREGEG